MIIKFLGELGDLEEPSKLKQKGFDNLKKLDTIESNKQMGQK